MEKRITSRTYTGPLLNFSTHRNGLPQASVMCIYEDAPTHGAAAHARRAVVNGTPVARQSWWNLNDFSQPGVLAGAAYTAMRADFIVVSLSCKEGLPLPFYVWANFWLPCRKVSGGTLVAVLDEQEGNQWAMQQAMQYLRQLAAHANMNFVVERPHVATRRHSHEETHAPAVRRHRVSHHSSEHPVLAASN